MLFAIKWRKKLKIKIDKIIRSRRKTLSLQIGNDGKLTVRSPLKISVKRIEKAVEEKSDWIFEKQREAYRKNLENPPKICAEGETFKLLGENYTLNYTEADSIKAADGRLLVPLRFKADAREAITSWYRAQAAGYLTGRVKYYSLISGIAYHSVRITGALSRWGSCSSAGRLCFTWRLAMAPPEMADYIVVHELLHIRHFDHSKEFWNGVAAVMPDYQRRREWFKRNSSLMRKDFFAEVSPKP